MSLKTVANDSTYPGLIDLAGEQLGGRAVACSDDFFAGIQNLLKPDPAIFIEDKYTERGKWMDGWETRRSYGRHWRRDAGPDCDWVVVQLAAPGIIHEIDVDTSHFRGNAPAQVSVETAFAAAEPQAQDWRELLAASDVRGDSSNVFQVRVEEAVNWVRLNIFPDGGVARLRVYGEVSSNPPGNSPGEAIDLAALLHGGRPVGCSDEFFGSAQNLLLPGKARNIGEGWETRRRRKGGYDWAIVRLGCRGLIEKIQVDTSRFVGNYPDRCSLQAACEETIDIRSKDVLWHSLVPETRLSPDRVHEFTPAGDLAGVEVSHVRLNIFPDGGVSRLRVWGFPKVGKKR